MHVPVGLRIGWGDPTREGEVLLTACPQRAVPGPSPRPLRECALPRPDPAEDPSELDRQLKRIRLPRRRHAAAVVSGIPATVQQPCPERQDGAAHC